MKITLTALALVLSACTSLNHRSKVVETRSVAPFDRIEVLGSSDLHVQVGAPLGLTVRAPADRIHLLLTEVRDGTLYITRAEGAEGADGASWEGSEDVAVTVPALVGIVVSGSAGARLEGFSGGELSAHVSGSGDLDARGQVDRLEASVSGSGDLNLGALAAREAQVRLSGSGDVLVWAEEAVDVVASGSGDVSVRGRPAISSLASHGSGRIRQR